MGGLLSAECVCILKVNETGAVHYRWMQWSPRKVLRSLSQRDYSITQINLISLMWRDRETIRGGVNTKKPHPINWFWGRIYMRTDKVLGNQAAQSKGHDLKKMHEAEGGEKGPLELDPFIQQFYLWIAIGTGLCSRRQRQLFQLPMGCSIHGDNSCCCGNGSSIFSFPNSKV